jgi:O-antigen/teichoic acid export membrane protein
MNSMNSWWHRYLPRSIQEWLEGRYKLQKVIGNTGWLLSEKCVQVIVGFLVGAWTAQYLGPERYGHLSYAFAFVGLFSTISILGLDIVGVREMVRTPKEKDTLVGTCLSLMVSAGILLSCLIIGTIFIVRPDDGLAQCLVAITALGTPFLAGNAIDFWFQSQVKSKYSTYARTTVLLLFSLVRIGLIVTKAELTTFAWISLVEIIVRASATLLVYGRTGNEIQKLQFSLTTARTLLKSSWPLILSSFVYLLYMRIDQIMIGEMMGSHELGIYSVAVRISEGWWIIPSAICASIFSDIVKSGTTNDILYYARLQKLYNTLVAIAYSLCIPVTLLSGVIIRLLFGPAYAKSGPVLAVLVWTGVFSSIGSARIIYLSSKNWNGLELLLISWGCIVNIAMNIVLIPRYGAMGAAVSTCVASWFYMHGACFIVTPLRKTGVMITKALVFPKVW